MMRKFVFQSAVVVIGAAAAGLGFGDNARALTFAESSDVGQLVDSSYELGAGYTGIEGNLWAKAGYDSGSTYNGKLNDRADLYKFVWEGGDFSAQTFKVSGNLDTQLFLFNVRRPDAVGVDENGNPKYGGQHEDGKSVHPGYGLAYNDNINKSTTTSKLEIASLNPGVYFLGVSAKYYNPIDIEGNQIFKSQKTGQVLATSGTKTLGDWGGSWATDHNIDGRYKVVFSGPTGDSKNIPEPATVIGTLLAGGYGMLRKYKQKNRVSSNTGAA
jgi:hypothetical protein